MIYLLFKSLQRILLSSSLLSPKRKQGDAEQSQKYLRAFKTRVWVVREELWVSVWVWQSKIRNAWHTCAGFSWLAVPILSWGLSIPRYHHKGTDTHSIHTDSSCKYFMSHCKTILWDLSRHFTFALSEKLTRNVKSPWTIFLLLV